MYNVTSFDSSVVPDGLSLNEATDLQPNISREVGREADAESIHVCWMTPIDQADIIQNQLCTAVNRDQSDAEFELNCCYSW